MSGAQLKYLCARANIDKIFLPKILVLVECCARTYGKKLILDPPPQNKCNLSKFQMLLLLERARENFQKLKFVIFDHKLWDFLKFSFVCFQKWLKYSSKMVL